MALLWFRRKALPFADDRPARVQATGTGRPPAAGPKGTTARLRDRARDVTRANVSTDRAESLSPSTAPLVVFVPTTHVPWLRGLKPGFRHCFVVVRRDDRWLALDALKGRIDVQLLPVAATFPLAAFYRRRGLRVLSIDTAPPERGRFGLRPLTCVEVVKQTLGLHAPFVVTPWQLYRRLVRGGAAETAPERAAGIRAGM